MVLTYFARSLQSVLARSWQFNRTLTAAFVLNLFLVPTTLLLMVIDPVTITGVNGWTKPFKFAVSVVVYTGTLLWLLPMVQRRKGAVGLLATTVGAILIGEIAIIVLQVVRGTSSHFNNTTPFDAVLFSAMGAMITGLAVLNLVVAIWLLRQYMENQVIATGLRWALFVTVAGMFVAFLMTVPTASQLEALAAGTSDGIIGAHSVGLEDGGPGLPVLGWSTTGGDLRVPHFVGLHALQMIPLLAWMLDRPWARRRWKNPQRVAMVHIGGATYLVMLALLTWQALRAQPVISPDLLTLAAFGALFASAAAATFVVTRSSATSGTALDPSRA